MVEVRIREGFERIGVSTIDLVTTIVEKTIDRKYPRVEYELELHLGRHV